MKKFHTSRLRQRGVTLTELMVGIVIGILVVAVAMGALMVSRKVSGTVSDSSDIQQQAAYAMRVIGQQIRQANVVRLALYPDALGFGNPEDSSSTQDSTSPVILIDESKRRNESWPISYILTDAEHDGNAGPRIIFVNNDDLSTNIEKHMWSANCLGDIAAGLNYSHFILRNNNLACASSYSTKPENKSYQPVLRNVADFQTRYIMYETDDVTGQQKIKHMEAHEVHTIHEGWSKVQGVEICLTLFGQEIITVPEGATYQGCDGDEKKYEDIQSETRQNRQHMTFRSVFQIRGQGGLTPPPTTS